MARPTVYSSAIIKKTKEYIDICGDDIYEYHKTRGDKSDTYERRVKVSLPTIEGLALHLGVRRSTVYEWRDRYPAFSDTLDALLATQAVMLQNGGISGDYNPLITKLILSHNHGMKERSDLTTDDKPIETNAVVFADFNEAGSE